MNVHPGFTGGVSAPAGAAPATAAAPAATTDAGSSPQPASDATPPQTAEPSEPGSAPPGTVRFIRKLKAQKHELKEQLAAREAELTALRNKMASQDEQPKQENEAPQAAPAAPPPAQPKPTTPPQEDEALDQSDEEVEQLKAERRVARALGLSFGPQLDAVVKLHRVHDLDPQDALFVAQGRFPDLFPRDGGHTGAGFAAAVPMQPRGLSPAREPPKPVDPKEAMRQRANDPRLTDAEREQANIALLNAELLPIIIESGRQLRR